jgi:predicted AlkP superfamily pyrophosphatase or phosphodiesterase
MEEGDITGATPSNNQTRSNSSTPIVVSYRNPEIKQRVVRAAQAANIWNLQMPTFKETNQVSKKGWTGNTSALTVTDWGLESGPRPTLRDQGRTGVTGRLPAYGKHGNRIRSHGALNLIGASGYHSKNGSGTTPTPPAGHPTAPKTKTPKKMK